MTLPQALVAALMVRIHRIELVRAREWVDGMDDEELRRRWRMYRGLVFGGRASGGECQICLRRDRRLVRDHDHATGFSRGRLCNPCNGWLGLLERHPESYYLRKKPGNGSWRKWVRENAERICAYLSQPPSGVWHSEGLRRKIQARERAGVELSTAGPTQDRGQRLFHPILTPPTTTAGRTVLNPVSAKTPQAAHARVGEKAIGSGVRGAFCPGGGLAVNPSECQIGPPGKGF